MSRLRAVFGSNGKHLGTLPITFLCLRRQVWQESQWPATATYFLSSYVAEPPRPARPNPKVNGELVDGRMGGRLSPKGAEPNLPLQAPCPYPP
jgi:hypothetical protein